MEKDFYSSDSDFDDDEPRKFHIQIRPASSEGRSSSAANEMELRATVGALTLPPNRGVSIKRQLSRNSSCTAGVRSEGEGEGTSHRECKQDRLRGSTSSPDRRRLSSTVSGSEALFGPPLESVCKTSSFTDAAFSSDSSSPENVEDSGLDSPSHQPLGPSPEPAGWAAWPAVQHTRGPAGLSRLSDPFLTAFRDPSPGCRADAQDDLAGTWGQTPDSATILSFPAFDRPETEPSVWSCRHIPQEDPFLAAFDQPVSSHPPPPPGPWAPPPPPPPCRSRDSREDSRLPIPPNDSKTVPAPCSISTQHKDRDPSVPVYPEDPFSITMIGSPTHQATQCNSRSLPDCSSTSGSHSRKEVACRGSASEHNPFRDGRKQGAPEGQGQQQTLSPRNDLPITGRPQPLEDQHLPQLPCRSAVTPPPSQQHSAEFPAAAPARPARARRTPGPVSNCEMSGSMCSSPLPDPSPPFTSSSSSSSPSEWVGPPTTPRPSSPSRGLSRGPSPISLSTQESWPVAAALTEYINAYFKGGQHNRCLVKITGDLTMSFPAGITRIFSANPNPPVLSFRLVNIARVDQFLPNHKLLFSDPSQSDPDCRDFWFNMQALRAHLQRETELNPQASYYNVGILKYQVSSQDPGCTPLLLSAECQRSGTVTRISLDYHCSPTPTDPPAQLSAVQVLLPLDHSATDPQCQPPASWNAEERRLLWKLPNLSPSNNSKGAGSLCASWQCLEAPWGPPPSLAVQFVGSGASLSGMEVELVGGRYRMSLVKKRFATGKYMVGCSL
ncbi:hypothetical protein AGOR_G00145670 [Albula goreensis]|uniref:MHD domain-containing protein n=1 Tax=Albula goreensis TaxID=1534307 RepID=A0A8T3D4V7_9TELE|nr:hypothetical protein AGOR_G00145670 [Albula goreensis]